MSQINNPLSSKFDHIFSYCFEEILGIRDWEIIAQNSGADSDLVQVNDIPSLQKVLIKNYGLKTAQGIWQRVGRVAFHQIRRYFEPFIQFNQGENRYKPLSFRLPEGLLCLNEFFIGTLDCQLSVISQGKDWYVEVNHCPECSHKEEDHQDCFFLRGLLQEYLLWTDARKDFRIEETQCGGGHCRFDICIVAAD